MPKPNQRTLRVVFIVIALLFLLIAGLGWLALGRTETSSPESVSNTAPTKQDGTVRFILDDYPIEIVPLHKMIDIQSSKFFVNHDPKNNHEYFGQPVNYYNVVYKTEATPEQTFAHYRSLMTNQNTDSVPEEQVQGQIGKYKVSVSQYETNPDTVYLQVYLPTDEYQQANRYYTHYPDLGLVDETWANYESSYGLLNQKGGQVEYTQYFALPLNSDVLIDAFKAKKQTMQNYAFNEETGTMQWQEEANTVTLTFSKQHQRIYLMIRRPMGAQ